MCTRPVTLLTGEKVGCQECEQCKLQVANDWVGRCIAESKVSAHTLRLDLTYGSDPAYAGKHVDHRHAQVLCYSDVQDYLKRLRIYTEGTVRFMCTGEKGSANGRAHWHLVLFFKGKLPPNIVMFRRYIHDATKRDENGKTVGEHRSLWPHGWSYWSEANARSIRYAAKYILKDIADTDQREHRFSQIPPLGHDWFNMAAMRYVKAKLSPQSTMYEFPESIGPDGTPFRYKMSVATAYYFFTSFMDYWRVVYGNEDWPASELVEKYFEEQIRRQRIDTGDAVASDDDFVRREEVIMREKGQGWLRGLREYAGSAGATKGMLYPPSVIPINQYRKSKG